MLSLAAGVCWALTAVLELSSEYGKYGDCPFTCSLTSLKFVVTVGLIGMDNDRVETTPHMLGTLKCHVLSLIVV